MVRCCILEIKKKKEVRLQRFCEVHISMESCQKFSKIASLLFPLPESTFPPPVSPLSNPLQSDFHLGLTFGTYFMYSARSVARIALSIIFRVALYSSRERPLRIWFPWRETERSRESELCIRKERLCILFNDLH